MEIPRQISVYQPLTERDGIRLIHFFRFGTQLHGRLEEVVLSKKPIYHALSYVWHWRPQAEGGGGGGTKTIYLNGREVEVTANLAGFIDTITQIWTPVPAFWVDAMCINQKDNAEKSSQVRMMGEIYQRATRIITWLGKHDEGSRTCIKKMWKWHALALQFKARYPSWDLMKDAYPEWLREVGVIDGDGCLVDRDIWLYFAAVFKDRQWWHRVWTVQEFIADVDKLFLCGDSSFTHHCLYDALFIAKLVMGFGELGMGNPEDERLLTDGTRLAMAAENLRNEFYGDPHFRLILYEVLDRCRPRSSTDPRDKVFAVLGLVKPILRAQALLSIDYNLSASEVFTNTAEYMLTTSGRLTWLGGVFPPSSGTNTPCPSWAPDWSNTETIMTLPCNVKYIPGVTPNRTSLLSSSSISSTTCPAYAPWPERYPGPLFQQLPQIIRQPTGAELHVEAVILDEIKFLCSSGPPHTTTPSLPLVTQWAEALCHGRETYAPTGEAMLRATLRTLVFDVDVLGPGELTRPPGGLDQLAGLAVGEAVRRFIFGITESCEGEGVGKGEGNGKGSGRTTIIDYDKIMNFTERRERLRGRRPVITTEGRIGIAPNHAVAGDLICAFAGGMHLYIVREIDGDPGRHTFVGEAYVHGLMDGEWKDLGSIGDAVEMVLV